MISNLRKAREVEMKKKKIKGNFLEHDGMRKITQIAINLHFTEGFFLFSFRQQQEASLSLLSSMFETRVNFIAKQE
jgi:hypothetical protein